MMLGKTGAFYRYSKHIRCFMLFKIVNKQRKSDQNLGKNMGSNAIVAVIYSISIRKQMQKTWILGNLLGGAWP